MRSPFFSPLFFIPLASSRCFKAGTVSECRRLSTSRRLIGGLVAGDLCRFNGLFAGEGAQADDDADDATGVGAAAARDGNTVVEVDGRAILDDDTEVEIDGGAIHDDELLLADEAEGVHGAAAALTVPDECSVLLLLLLLAAPDEAAVYTAPLFNCAGLLLLPITASCDRRTVEITPEAEIDASEAADVVGAPELGDGATSAGVCTDEDGEGLCTDEDGEG